jgi:hypothetical protein
LFQLSWLNLISLLQLPVQKLIPVSFVTAFMAKSSIFVTTTCAKRNTGIFYYSLPVNLKNFCYSLRCMQSCRVHLLLQPILLNWFVFGSPHSHPCDRVNYSTNSFPRLTKNWLNPILRAAHLNWGNSLVQLPGKFPVLLIGRDKGTERYHSFNTWQMRKIS